MKRSGSISLENGLQKLEQARKPLFRELKVLIRDPAYLRGEPAHLCCTRERNQMRITPLEAQSIAQALYQVPELRRRLPEIIRRIEAELTLLKDDTRRQNFQCPLLEGTRCLVHDVAKPIGCAAWNPGSDYTRTGWNGFMQRDRINDQVYGSGWKLRAIPLWLKRVLGLHGAASPGASPPRQSKKK